MLNSSQRHLVRACLAASLALALPAQSWACTEALADTSREALQVPAGVKQYRQAAIVAVVRIEAVAQPPCIWIKVSRWLRPGAYPDDFCTSAGRSQRYRVRTIEPLKGAPPEERPARFHGVNPLSGAWLARHRPEASRMSPGVWAREDPFDRALPNDAVGHSAFAFQSGGQIADPTVDIPEDSPGGPGSCSGRSAPLVEADLNYRAYIVFWDENGVIWHWEPIITPNRDLLVERLRRLRAGDTDVRPTIDIQTYISKMPVVSLYEVQACGANPRVGLAGGGRVNRLDEVVNWRFRHLVGREQTTCRAGQRYLALAPGQLSTMALYESQWPSVDLVPVHDDRIRLADITSQFRVVGPPTLSVTHTLADVATRAPAFAGTPGPGTFQPRS